MSLPKGLVVVRAPADRQQHELVRQQVGAPQLVEGRDHLAVGQVAGPAEQDEDGRVRHPLEPQALRGGRSRPAFDLDVLRPWWASRRSFIVRGASLARGAGRAGIGWSGGASPGAVSTGAVSTAAFEAVVLLDAVAPFVRLDATAGYSVLTAWPPNSLRSAASTLAPYESSWRERKRVSSDSVITGAGTSWSIASWIVQRPSPESAT